ncbi:MAG: hypothetical protein HWE27_07425 [Gammaproteobacteria bacterium]|nr:hypothetical protein [Gammaproteobacteria bacterium]
MEKNTLVTFDARELSRPIKQSLVGYPRWMMQLLGAQEISQGDLKINGRELPERLDTVEQVIEMLTAETAANEEHNL